MLPQKCGDVSELINQQTVREHENNRRILGKIIQNLQFLGRQGIAIQGANDSESNFMQLLLLRSKDDPSIILWINKKNRKIYVT